VAAIPFAVLERRVGNEVGIIEISGSTTLADGTTMRVVGQAQANVESPGVKAASEPATARVVVLCWPMSGLPEGTWACALGTTKPRPSPESHEVV
jgi:hypothetical protein